MKKKLRDCSQEETDVFCRIRSSKGSACVGCPLSSNEDSCLGLAYRLYKGYLNDKALNIELDIPSPHILDKEEHDYLRAVCKPYKVKFITLNQWVGNIYYLKIVVEDKITSTGRGVLELPLFKKDTMYKGMKLGKEYTIEDLELDKEWKE